MQSKDGKRNFNSWGDFKRVIPFCDNFGYTRGVPVDRYYIENFLEKNARLIRGRVLEIGDNEYTIKYGGANVHKSDILHVDPNNPAATIIGDLSNLPQVNDEFFDCIILTQTLHLILNYANALNTCFRILKQSGALLITVPGITSIDKGEWKDSWYWSFTPSSLKMILDEVFGTNNHKDEAFGNLISAIAFLYGMGKQEISSSDLDNYDSFYPVLLTACCIRQSNSI